MGSPITMHNPITRRRVLQAGVATSASLLIGPAAMARTYSANEKIRFALVGIGGMGGKGVNVASAEQIVAAADVDVNHAAGSIIVTEAGGHVSDTNGLPLDFSLGRTLRHNKGVVATNGHLHDVVIEALTHEVSGVGLQVSGSAKGDCGCDARSPKPASLTPET